MSCVTQVSLALLDLSILGNKYINTDFKYPTDPYAGLRNRYKDYFSFLSVILFSIICEEFISVNQSEGLQNFSVYINDLENSI